MERWLFLLCAVLVSGCNPQSRGFVLPDGNASRGAEALEALACTQCHSVGDIAWTGADDDVEIPLGGATTVRRTYGELLTSIINPSHRISRPYLGEEVAVDGESKMRRYNEVMSVQQLIDIVTYLETQYTLVTPSNPYLYRDW